MPLGDCWETPTEKEIAQPCVLRLRKSHRESKQLLFFNETNGIEKKITKAKY